METQNIFPRCITEWDYIQQDELYIGYMTIEKFKKYKYKTKRMMKNLFHLNRKWFPVYVKKWEWIRGFDPKWFPHYLPKRYNLRNSVCLKKHTLQ
jgi:hypothetical protein